MEGGREGEGVWRGMEYVDSRGSVEIEGEREDEGVWRGAVKGSVEGERERKGKREDEGVYTMNGTVDRDGGGEKREVVCRGKVYVFVSSG